MHDPLTVVADIYGPVGWTRLRRIHRAWKERKPDPKTRFPSPLFTIWHKDPWKGGTEDSCDWYWRKLNRKNRTACDDLIDNEVDNLQSWFKDCVRHDGSPDLEEMKRRIYCIVAAHRRRTRIRFWPLHPRWHFWHYHIQVPFLQHLWRWLAMRCATCGKRFTWGYAQVCHQWDATWRSPHYHLGECSDSAYRKSWKSAREAHPEIFFGPRGGWPGDDALDRLKNNKVVDNKPAQGL